VLPEKFQLVPPIRSRFIDRLDRLKRQRHPQRRDAVPRAVIFAFPNQFRPGDGERVLRLGCRLVALCHASEPNRQAGRGQARPSVARWRALPGFGSNAKRNTKLKAENRKQKTGNWKLKAES
jgi:hypothetical protein